MENEDFSIEEKAENLMNVVVESRKRFGKMCVDYDHKSSLMENKLLNLQIQTISNYRFKPKNPLTDEEMDGVCSKSDQFKMEVEERWKRLENLKKKIKDTHEIVVQLKEDRVGRYVKQPLTSEALILQAKEKCS